MKIRRAGLLTLMFIQVLAVYAAADVKFTAQAPKAVVVGDNFRLEYSVNVSNARNLKIPSIEGFRILAGPSTSSRSSTTIVNGKMESSSSVTYTYILVGEEEGEFTIPGATVEIKGDTYTSNDVKIKVLPQDSNSQQNQSATGSQQNRQSQPQASSSSSSVGNISNSDLFMRAIISKTNAYEQEALLLTYKVYTLVNLRSLSNSMPDLKNFHVQEVELPQNKEFELEHYNGRNYQTMIWRQYVLFPQQSGDLEIPSTSFDGVVYQTIQSADIFDMVFNGGRYVETNKVLTTAPIKVHVDPLPSGRSDSFMGGVGDFSISSSINTTELKANEAVTIRVILSGTGNLKLIKTPEIRFPQDFDVYDPKVENQFSLKSSGQTGNKVFEYLAIPRHAGQYDIPGLEFQYFDVKSGKYKTLTTESYTINVAKGEGSDAGTVSGYVSKEDLKFVGQDVRFHNTSGKLTRSDNVLFGSTLFWMLLILPVLILLAVLAVSMKRVRDNSNIVQSKRKKANSVAVKRLKQASRLMAENRKDEFYDETLRALCGYVSDKLSIPVADLSKDNIASELRGKNVDESIISELTKLISDCEFARYAPGDDNGRMDGIYKEAADVIGQMENVIRH
ncbi:MAG: BatD family protein [Bacteroidaceae bacterium]|nr:BatD family protein [Bacteroidaceae bacterium]